MSGKNAVGFGPCVLLALLASPPASAGVVNGVLSQWNLQAKECKDGQIDLGAMVNVGMFEAVNRIAGKYTPYLPGPAVRGTGSMEAAAASAAHDLLVALCPDQAEGFAGALKSSLAEVKDAKARDAGAKVEFAASHAAPTVEGQEQPLQGVAVHEGQVRRGEPDFE